MMTVYEKKTASNLAIFILDCPEKGVTFIDVVFRFLVSLTPEKQSWLRSILLHAGVPETAKTEEWTKARLPIPDFRISMILPRHRIP